MAYNKKHNIVNNGTKYKERVVVQQPTDAFKAIFNNQEIDINGPGVTKYTYTGKKYNKFEHTTDSKYNGEKVNYNMVELLNKSNFYNLNKNTTKKNTAIHGFTFSQQKGKKSSTIDSAVQAWTKLNKLRTNEVGSIFTFDTETIGGTSIDKRWNPLAMTEFAVQEYNFATKQRNTTNIIMANKENISVLDSIMKRYEEAYTKGGIEAIKKDNELWVSAMRLSLYDTARGAEFTFNKEKGYYEATKLLDSSDHMAGNIESVKRGYATFKKMAEHMEGTKDIDTGLTKDAIEYIKTVGKMQTYANNGIGIISGHNITDFDRPIVDMGINKIYQNQLEILNSKITEKEIKAQAQNAINLIHESFGASGNYQGEYIGLSFNKGSVLDTMTVARMARDTYGDTALYGDNKKAIFRQGLDAWGSKSASLEAITHALYPEEVKQGVAHLAAFDALMNQNIILKGSESLDGYSFIEHVMERAGGSGIIGLSKKKDAIVKLDSNKMFKATGNYAQSAFSGRGFLNSITYSNNETFTNGGFHIDAEGVISHTEYAGNTGFAKGVFYNLSKQNKIKIADLGEDVQKQIRASYPELNSEYLYSASFVSNHATSGKIGHTVNIVTTTQDELEGIISSNLTHVATKESDEWKIVQNNVEHLKTSVYKHKNGKVYTNKLKGETDKERLINAIKISDNIISSDRARRSVLKSDNAVKRVHDVLKFEKDLMSTELGEKVSAALSNGYSMSDILTFNHAEGYLNKEELKEVQNLFIKSAGYVHDGKQKIDFRTKQNLAYAYENITTRKDYYEKILNEVKETFEIKDFKEYWYDEKTRNNRGHINNFFLDLDKKVRVSVASNVAKPSQNIIDLANEVKGVSIGTAEDFKNRYDFKLGEKFKRIGKTPQKIIGPFSPYSEDDIVTFNIGKNGATTSFATDLYKRYMGDKHNPRRTDTEAQTKQAIYNFFMDLSNNREENKELFEYQELKDVIKNMKEHARSNEEEGIAGFDINQPLSVLQQAVEYAKNKNAGSGIIKGYGSRYDVNDINPRFVKGLNEVSSEEIKNNVNKMVKNISYGSDEQRQVEVKKILKSFTVSDSYFNEKTKHLDEDRVRILKLIQQDIEKKTETRINDIMNTCGYFGIDMYFDGHDIITSNGNTGTLIDSIPRFKIDDRGIAYVESGNSKLGLNLRTAVRGKGQDSRIYLTTNLDDTFGKEDYFLDMFIRKRNRNEGVNTTDFNKYTNFHKANLRESSMYTGTKYDQVYLNTKFDVSESYEKLYKDIFSDEGSLNFVLDKAKLTNPEMVDTFKKYQHKIQDGNIPPDLYMFGIPDMIEILSNVLDENDPNYKDLKYLLSIAGPGNKDTELSKGHLLLGDRVLGTLSNKYDNVARPPMYGSGNIQFLEKSKIEAVGEKSLVLAHSIAESADTMKIIHRDSIEGKLTSDFTYRQAFVSAPIINDKMKSQKEIILKANINNRTIKEMTEEAIANVYDGLIETVSSHTHEQARIMDARTFKGIINMPMNTQYISPNLDVIGAISEDTNQDKIALLNDLLGNVSIDESGKISYKKNKGTIVKKGDAILEYSGYGGINNIFGTKMNKGNLSFSVRDIDDIELSESSINKVLNKYANRFEGLAHEDRLNEFVNIMKSEGYKASFKIDNVNSASLPKLLSGGSEKGMALVLQSTVGELNLANREFFESLTNYTEKIGLDKTKYDFAGQNIITKDTVESALQDIARHVNRYNDDKKINYNDVFNLINKNNNFKDINSLMDSILDEQLAKSEMIFGKYGAFSGITSLANDNISKHGNIGLGTFGQFSEAVALYGKAIDKNHEMNTDSYYTALNSVKDLMNNNKDLNFFNETIEGSTIKGRAKKLSIKEGTLIVENNSKNEVGFLDNEKLENLMQKIDELIVKSYGGDESKIDESNRLKHEDINIPDGKGGYKKGTFYGSAFIRNSNGERYADGTVAMMNTSLVRDGETVSGVTQEYIDLNVAINKIKSKTKPEPEDFEELALLQTKASAIKDSIKFMKLDDQAVSILEQRNFSEHTALELESLLKLKDKDNFFNLDKAKYLEEATGSLIHIDENQKVIINRELSSHKHTNEIWLNKLKDTRYYDEFKGGELTPELLKANPHLQDVYDAIVTQGRAPKLGIKEAQDLYDLQRLDAAALFNKAGEYDIDTMQNKFGYKIMSIDDFVSAEGSAKTETIDDILKQNVLIDMGEHFGKGNDRYVASPGTGKVVGTEEIRKGWQRNIDQLKKDNDILISMEGDGLTEQFDYYKWSKTDIERKEAMQNSEIKDSAIQRRMETMARMKKTADNIGELTDHYNRKDGVFTQYSKIDVHEAQQRMKITSVTGDIIKQELFDGTELEGVEVEVSNTFMKHAKVSMGDGTKVSLHDLEARGIYHDYKRAGVEYFENAGYFKDETLKAFGFTEKQQMIDYLQENGTVTTSTRYPQIKIDSLYQSRTYLDTNYNGTNTISVAAHSMLKYKGDSDGDSESFFETKVDGISFALYEKKRNDAIEAVNSEGKNLSKLDFAKAVKEKALEDKTITEDAYRAFTSMNAEMARVAVVDNAEYVAEVKATQLKDIKSNIFTGASSIKYENEDGENTIFQIKNAISNTLSKRKMEPLREQPKAEELEKNLGLVNNYIKQAYETNPEAFSEKTRQYAKNIFEGKETANRITGTNKYAIVDETLAHFEKDLNLSKDELGKIESALTNRIRINQLFEEEAAKAGKGAIAPVNTSLYALKVAGKKVFGDASDEFYDSTKTGLISRMAYQIEESAISSKKVAYEMGDTRLLNIEEILQKAKKGHSNTQLKDGLSDWFNEYVDSSVTEDMWKGISATEKIKIQESNTLTNRIKYLKDNFKGNIDLITDEDWKIRAKNSIMSEKLLDSVNEIVGNDGGKSLVNVLASSGRRGSSAESMNQVGATSNKTMGGELLNVIREVPKSEADKVTEITTKTTYDATKYVKEYSDDVIAGLGEKILSNTPKVGGLGLTALGVAAGLLVAGYAGGHNVSRPTPPVDDTQPPPQTVPEFFDQQVSSVQPTGDQRGYVINVKADTNRGERHMKRAMKEAVRATSASGNISVNMNYRTTRSGGYSNKDIEDIINNYI